MFWDKEFVKELSSLNNCDLLKYIISFRGSHCDYSPRTRTKPGNATGSLNVIPLNFYMIQVPLQIYRISWLMCSIEYREL
jgi:hypothetical protein